MAKVACRPGLTPTNLVDLSCHGHQCGHSSLPQGKRGAFGCKPSYDDTELWSKCLLLYTSHYSAFRRLVIWTIIFPATLNLVCTRLLLDLFGKVFAQKFFQLVVKIIYATGSQLTPLSPSH